MYCFIVTLNGASVGWFLKFTVTYSRPCHNATMENFEENSLQKRSSMDILQCPKYRFSRQRCSIKKLFLKILQNSQENTCVGVLLFNKVARINSIIKETLTQVISCEICEVFKNSFFIEHLQWWYLQIRQRLLQQCKFL